MIENILYEPILTHDYYGEYLKTISKYWNATRTSIFIRYLNINNKISIYNESTKGTSDKFNSGIYFDSYDYTPALQFDVNINSAVDRQDLNGFKFDGSTSVVVYTIAEPKMGDLILFPYEPYKSEEIFKVNSISTVLSTRNNNVISYKLGLEYAPLQTIADLKISNNFVYLLSQEKNILASEYAKIIQQLKNISTLLVDCQLLFNERHELYYYEMGPYKIAPININKNIYRYLCEEKFNRRYFDRYKKPFSVLDFTEDNIGIDILSNRLIKINPLGIPYINTKYELVEILDNTCSLLNYNNLTPLNIQLLQLSEIFQNFLG